MKATKNKRMVISSLIVATLIIILWGASIGATTASAAKPGQAATRTPTPPRTPTVPRTPTPPLNTNTTITTNLALNKPATGSEPCTADETATKAVDGRWATWADKWCSKAAEKWLQVDLLGEYYINNITIYHAGKGGEYPTYNTYSLKVQISRDNVNWTSVSHVNSANESKIVEWFGVARYIKIIVLEGAQPNQENIARIYELMVGGKPVTNVALNKPATSSAPCNTDEAAAKAVDGRWAILTDKWCSNVADKWLNLDLGQSYYIGSVKILHAGVGNEPVVLNTWSYAILMSFDNVNWYYLNGVTANTANETSFNAKMARGRYFRINVIDGGQHPDENIARLYEIEIMAPAP